MTSTDPARHPRRSRTAALLAAATVLTLGLAGCGFGQNEPDASSATPTDPAVSASSSTDAGLPVDPTQSPLATPSADAPSADPSASPSDTPSPTDGGGDGTSTAGGAAGDPGPLPLPGSSTMMVGAFSNTLHGATVRSFESLRDQDPGLTVRRSFVPGIVPDVSRTQAAGDQAAGITTFLSVKPSWKKVGSDDDAIASLARSLPAGSYLTAWHEPENDMSASAYVAMFRNFYQVAKAANPSIYVGNVYMSYQWGPGHNVSDPDAWWVGSDYTDFLGTDTYMDTWQRDRNGNPVPVQDAPDHQRWHAWASTKGKPLLVPELGVGQGFSDAQRAEYLRSSLAWMQANGYRMVLLWNGAGTPPNGESWDFSGGDRSWPLTVSAVRDFSSVSSQDTRL